MPGVAAAIRSGGAPPPLPWAPEGRPEFHRSGGAGTRPQYSPRGGAHRCGTQKAATRLTAGIVPVGPASNGTPSTQLRLGQLAIGGCRTGEGNRMMILPLTSKNFAPRRDLAEVAPSRLH